MNKRMLLSVSLISITAVLAFIAITRPSKEMITKPDLVIGIIQTVVHPALDQTREGFIARLQQEYGDKIGFVHQIAHGQVSQAHQIAQSFRANSGIKALFTIGSQATQAAVSTGNNKPLFYASVTDPHDLGLDTPQANACGSSDRVNPENTIELIKELLPQAKTVALLYNPGETNSALIIKEFKEKLTAKNFTIVTAGITSATEVRPATHIACQSADVVLAPTDNLVAATIPTITEVTRKDKKPLFVSDNLLVPHGALGSCGVDYKEQGKMAAQCVIEVFKNGKKPEMLPIARPSFDTTVINKKVADELGIEIPKQLLKTATIV